MQGVAHLYPKVTTELAAIIQCLRYSREVFRGRSTSTQPSSGMQASHKKINLCVLFLLSLIMFSMQGVWQL